MSIRANNILQKQDSILAYLKANQQMQAKLYASLFDVSEKKALELNKDLYYKALMKQNHEFRKLTEQKYTSVLR